MKLYEYQGREIFEQHGIPTPSGVVVESVDELEAVRDELDFPVVVKAQVLVGGRGKAGGIKFADTFDEARQHTEEILGMDLKGYEVKKVFLVEMLDFQEELYLSVVLDRSERSALVMLSQEGGVDIESVPQEKIAKVHVDPLIGLQPFQLRRLNQVLDLPKDTVKEINGIISKLVPAFFDGDAELLEINPLAVTPQGVVAGDAKVVLNDAALFRHPDVERVTEDMSDLELEADEKGIAFVQLDGDIGVIANGAGLTMATLDAIKHYGGEGGVFLDLGGTDSPEKVKECFRLLKKANPSVVLLNLFGGITKTDTVAKGIKQVLAEEDITFPIVTRIKGVNEEKARSMLAEEEGLTTAEDLEEAAQRTVELEKEVSA